MRILFIVLFLLFQFSSGAFAETVNLNVTGWTQSQINSIKAMTAMILYDNSITHDGIDVMGEGIVDIVNPSGSVSVITGQAILDAYDVREAEMEYYRAIAVAKKAARDQEIASSSIKDINLDAVNTKIDNISSLADLKVFLKKFVRYLVAKGVLDN